MPTGSARPGRPASRNRCGTKKRLARALHLRQRGAGPNHLALATGNGVTRSRTSPHPVRYSASLKFHPSVPTAVTPYSGASWNVKRASPHIARLLQSTFPIRDSAQGSRRCLAVQRRSMRQRYANPHAISLPALNARVGKPVPAVEEIVRAGSIGRRTCKRNWIDLLTRG